MSKIYVASSWRNKMQSVAVSMLRELGHEVYDFKEDNGFNWSDIDPRWKEWTPNDYINILETESYTSAGFETDKSALDNCDICVLLLPCNRSSHLELGYAIGKEKGSIIVLDDSFEPELMYLLSDVIMPKLDKDLLEKSIGFICQSQS